MTMRISVSFGSPILFPLPKPRASVISDLIAEAEKIEGLPPGTVRGRNRRPHESRARFAVAYAARRMTSLSYPQIGRSMGGFDHSSIIYAERRAIQMRDSDPVYRAKLAALMWNVRAKRRARF